MLNGKRIVAWTPFGRRETVSILLNYLRRDIESGLLDEYWLYMNTDPIGQEDDMRYAHELEDSFSWVRIIHIPPGISRLHPKQANTGFAYRYMTDPDSVFLRFDDDIVYVHEDAVRNLVERRLSMPYSTAVFPIIWNNAVVSWYAQQAGVMPREYGEVSNYCMDPVGWANGGFAVKIHNLLLDRIDSADVGSLYLYQDFALPIGHQFSVSCFASLGSDYAALPDGPGVLSPSEEEYWHTVFRPTALKHPNMLIGNSLVSHYSFYPQRDVLGGTDILDRYRSLSEKL